MAEPGRTHRSGRRLYLLLIILLALVTTLAAAIAVTAATAPHGQTGQEYHSRRLIPHWAKYDKMVDMAAKYGLQIIARLDRPPAWARPTPSSGRGPVDNYSDYGDFVFSFVQRYQGRIRYLQIWNEPNLWYEWG